MERTVSFSLAAIVTILLSPPARSQPEQALALMKIRELYGPSASVQAQTIMLSDSVLTKVTALAGVPYNSRKVTVQCFTSDKRPLFAVTDNVFGKEQPITYMTVFDNTGRIRAVEILTYREAYGGEVRYESFRKQFDGKDYADDLRVGGVIRNITGATISATAVTTGIRKVAALFHIIKSELQ